MIERYPTHPHPVDSARYETLESLAALSGGGTHSDVGP